MGAWDMIRQAAAGMPSPEERYEAYRPSFERNGLHAMVDPEGSGFMHLESGHRLLPVLHDDHPGWDLHVGHESDPDLRRKVTVSLGDGDHDVGDRIVRALRRPEVLRSMRDQMNPGTGGDGTWPRNF